jgi:hypothetical protein
VIINITFFSHLNIRTHHKRLFCHRHTTYVRQTNISIVQDWTLNTSIYSKLVYTSAPSAKQTNITLLYVNSFKMASGRRSIPNMTSFSISFLVYFCICSSLNDAFSETRTYSIEWKGNSEWWIRKYLEGSGHDLILRYYSRLSSVGTEKKHENLCHDSRSLGRDLNPGLSEYKAGAFNHKTTRFGLKHEVLQCYKLLKFNDI